MKRLLLVCFVVLLLTACTKKEEMNEVKEMNTQFIGSWAGDIEIPNTPLPIIIALEKDGGNLSVPLQGLKNYPFKSITYNGDKVSISIDLNGSAITIAGELKEDKIVAAFKQNGGTFPITLTRYEVEPVSYESLTIPVENGQLKVALQKPAGVQTSPVALILAGSGPTDKDGNTAGAGGNNSLKMLAEQLADQGVATIRYDKRGVGENMGLVSKEEELTIDQYVDDAVKVIQYLSSQDNFTSIHVIGHSEGSLIGMLAAEQAKVESFVSLAGAGRTADELLLEQLEGQLTPALKTETVNTLDSLKKGELVDNVSPELESLFRASVQPYMISWLHYNPVSIIGQLNSRTLIVQGTNDLQINEVDAQGLKNGKSDAKLLYLDGMNHVLKNAPSDRAGNLTTYTNPELPLHAELVPAILQFIENE